MKFGKAVLVVCSLKYCAFESAVGLTFLIQLNVEGYRLCETINSCEVFFFLSSLLLF